MGSVLIWLCVVFIAIFIAVDKEVALFRVVSSLAINNVSLSKYVSIPQRTPDLQNSLTSQNHCQSFRSQSISKRVEDEIVGLPSSQCDPYVTSRLSWTKRKSLYAQNQVLVKFTARVLP